MIKDKKLVLKSGKKYHIKAECFNSAMDMAKSCRERKITDSQFKDMAVTSINTSFEGVKSYGEALDLLQNGYQPTVEKLKECAKVFGTTSKNRVHNDIVGYAPVVPLAMQGIPQSMINMKKLNVKTKVIDVYYDVGCSAYVSPESIIRAGQEMLSTIISMEGKGYKFNIYGIQGYSDSETADLVAIKIKSSSQPTDIKRMSFPLTHPAFFRVIGFDWYSKFPIGKYRMAYGCPFSKSIKKEEEQIEAIKQMFGNQAVYISAQKIVDSGFKKGFISEQIEHNI